jgi:Single-strand binding protein family
LQTSQDRSPAASFEAVDLAGAGFLRGQQFRERLGTTEGFCPKEVDTIASDLNHVSFSGRCAATPVSRNDGMVCGFSVAINGSIRRDDGSWEDVADFVDLSVFNGLAQRCMRQLRKGDRVTIHGRLSQNGRSLDADAK